MVFTFGKYDIDINLRARRSWRTLYRTNSASRRRLVFGRLSVTLEDWQARIHPVCAQCRSSDVGERGYGDEGWTVCNSCESVEGGYVYVNLREYESA